MSTTGGHMKRKKKSRKAGTRSSYSGRTGKSKTTAGLLELGRTLVGELQLDPGVDTLGRWMAHHIAELIKNVDQAATAESKRLAKRQAELTILNLWRHRSSIDNRINPLHDLKPILKFIQDLEQSNVFWVRENGAARKVHNVYSRLIACMALKAGGSIGKIAKATDRANVIVDFLSPVEQKLISSLSMWVDGVSKDPVQKFQSKEPSASRDLNNIAKVLIAEMRTALDELEKEISEDRGAQAPEKKTRL